MRTLQCGALMLPLPLLMGAGVYQCGVCEHQVSPEAVLHHSEYGAWPFPFRSPSVPPPPHSCSKASPPPRASRAGRRRHVARLSQRDHCVAAAPHHRLRALLRAAVSRALHAACALITACPCKQADMSLQFRLYSCCPILSVVDSTQHSPNSLRTKAPVSSRSVSNISEIRGTRAHTQRHRRAGTLQEAARRALLCCCRPRLCIRPRLPALRRDGARLGVDGGWRRIQGRRVDVRRHALAHLRLRCQRHARRRRLVPSDCLQVQARWWQHINRGGYGAGAGCRTRAARGTGLRRQ